MSIPAIGTRIWANIVRPGFIVETEAGERIEVQRVDEGYDTITLNNLHGRSTTVGYADLVTVLGYFNPE